MQREPFSASMWSPVEIGGTIVEVKRQEQDEGRMINSPSWVTNYRVEGDTGQRAVKRLSNLLGCFWRQRLSFSASFHRSLYSSCKL